jgi:hypothetical protein
LTHSSKPIIGISTAKYAKSRTPKSGFEGYSCLLKITP